MPRRPALALALALTLATLAPARGGVINGYDPASAVSRATHDRFAAGWPSAPVANSSAAFVGAGLDLSGIGWISGSTAAVTLISDRYVIGAAHVGGFNAGASLTFVGSSGAVVTRTVESATVLTTTFTDSQGQQRTLPSDLRVARLSGTLTAAEHGVRRVGIADPATVAPGLGLLVHGQNTAYGANNFYLGRNTLDRISLESFTPDAGGDPQNEATLTAIYQAGTAAGNGYLTPGDSGGPLLARTPAAADLPALAGVHYGVTNPNIPLDGYPADPNEFSASSFAPAYIDQINQVMAADNLTVLVVPVPEPAGLVLVAAAGVWAARRRRRAA